MKIPLDTLNRLAIISAVVFVLPSSVANATTKTVIYTSTPVPLRGYLCRPPGRGPFPLVVFNHGGLGNIIRGAPSKICAALEKAGFVGLAPIRRQTRSMRGHIDDVFAGMGYGLSLPYVDPRRAALMGFSRGGLLALMAATQRDDLQALVVMAPAMGRRGQMSMVMDNSDAISASVLLMVAKNDTGSRRTLGQNTLAGSRSLTKALQAAGRNVRLIEYPPYGSDGHTMFFGDGDYWRDVIVFLRKHL